MVGGLMILGLSGQAGSGKDFIANILVNEYGFTKIAFADPLKRICKEVFDFSDEQLWGPSAMRNTEDPRYQRLLTFEDGTIRTLVHSAEDPTPVCLSPRYALQKLGTEWGRDCYQNTWVDLAIRTAKTLLASNRGLYYSPQQGLQLSLAGRGTSGVVIPDVRFQNELDALHQAGSKVVRIYRDVATTLSGAAAAHSSEQEQKNIPDSAFDFILHNVKDPKQLDKSIKEMMNVIRK